jgi:maltose/moltooligosaccharide transporter
LFIQPLIGAWSDRTWSDRWGRRKPFFITGAIGCSVGLFFFPFVSALWMAVLLLWLLDASNNTAMEPYRAFLADKLTDSQLAKGFLTQSFFTGLGITLANVSLFVFEKILSGTTSAGIPYWVFGSFMLGAVCSIGSILVSVLKTPENRPSDEELAVIRAKPRGLVGGVREIKDAVRDMPASMHKLGLVYMFQWYAIVVYWQYVSLSIAKSVWHTTPANEGLYSQAVAWTGLVNGAYNVVTFCVAFWLVGLARRYGAKWVHVGALLCAFIGLYAFAHIGNRYALFLPMIGLGIAWASMMGVPYIMVVSLIPKERYGVYMGIVNMMIVVPMLIETFSFGFIYDHFLHTPTHALEFSAVLFAVAAVAMTWLRPPKKQSPVIPLTYRQIMGYDRVLVGTDGSPSSLLAVERAGQVASASEAELVVVTAYDPVPARDAAILNLAVGNLREHQIRGKAHAEETLEGARELVNTERVRAVRELAVEGEPADAILATAAEQRADLIVIGNRGMGALSGHLLGSVPGDIAHRAPCDVLIVQTEQIARDEQLSA